MRRRDFLKAGAATSALAMLPGRAYGAWGDAPLENSGLLLPPGVRAERCLELFLDGGMPSFHSFYAVPDYGKPTDPNPAFQNTQYYQFAQDKAQFWNQCGAGNDPALWLTPFGTDALKKQVNLTPMVGPLLSRPDVLARTRVVVMMHDLLVHEIGAPIMLTGNRLGNPRMAGTATHVQRYWQDRDTTGRLVPYSFAMLPEGASSSLNLAAASAVGQHPGSARPLTISTSVNTVIGDLVGRKYLGSDVTRVDQLLDYYSARNTGRYVDGAGVPLRSRGVADHEFAISSLINAPNLEEVLTPNLFNAPSRATCGVNNNADVSAMTIEAACALLTHPTTPAKMVHVVDGGTTTFGTLTYDLHSQLVENGTLNMRHALGTLMGQINEEGEGDPTKLDIEDTLIVLNAEFGRAPVPQGGDVPGGGSDHFPWGFVSVIIGGPVQQGVTGAIGPDGYAVEYVTPTEFRAAILAALGIYPFSAQSYAVGDIRDVENEADGLAWLNEIVLGRS